MPRISRSRARERDLSPVRTQDTAVPPSPPRSRRNLKRTASQALPPTPPRTVKRERRTRTTKDTHDGASSKAKSPTRTRKRGLKLETELERLAEEEEEQEEKEAVSLNSAIEIGCRLDFGPVAKRRKLEELDARLETLLESLDGKADDNPFWDGPTRPEALGAAGKAEKADGNEDSDDKSSTDKRGRTTEKEDTHENSAGKAVRIRSPSPPLMSFRVKAPVSPPPSNRRKKKVRGKATVSTVIEEEPEISDELLESSSLHRSADPQAGETSAVESVAVRLDSSEEEPLVKANIELPFESAEEPLTEPGVEPLPSSAGEASTGPKTRKSPESAKELLLLPKPSVRHPSEAAEDPFSEPEISHPVLSMPSTPKKGKNRMELPIRDSPDNPFLDESPASIAGEIVEPRTPTIGPEKPTTTYLFRGVRVEFANPMYNLPPEVHERSLLPLEHPDYSPNPACPPKRLFTKPRRRQVSPSPIRHRGRNSTSNATTSTAPAAGSIAVNGWDDSDDEAELHITPPKRLFH